MVSIWAPALHLPRPLAIAVLFVETGLPPICFLIHTAQERFGRIDGEALQLIHQQMLSNTVQASRTVCFSAKSQHNPLPYIE